MIAACAIETTRMSDAERLLAGSRRDFLPSAKRRYENAMSLPKCRRNVSKLGERTKNNWTDFSP